MKFNYNPFSAVILLVVILLAVFNKSSKGSAEVMGYIENASVLYRPAFGGGYTSIAYFPFDGNKSNDPLWQCNRFKMESSSLVASETFCSADLDLEEFEHLINLSVLYRKSLLGDGPFPVAYFAEDGLKSKDSGWQCRRFLEPAKNLINTSIFCSVDLTLGRK